MTSLYELSPGVGVSPYALQTRSSIRAGRIAAASDQSHPSKPLLRGMRVLCVDDDRDAADSLALVVRLLGFQAMACYDGDAALQAAAGFKPHVCMLDVRLRGMDGCELARRLRQQAGVQSPAFIAASAFGSAGVRQMTAAAGFQMHLVKPLDLDSLPEILVRLGRDAAEGW